MPTDLLACLREVANEIEGLQFALLFGSHSRGEARADSDVDVAISGGDALDFYAAATAALGREGDVVSLSGGAFGRLAIPLLERLLRDGKLILERKPGAYGAWMAAALAVLETDRPAYERMRDAYVASVAEGSPRAG